MKNPRASRSLCPLVALLLASAFPVAAQMFVPGGGGPFASGRHPSRLIAADFNGDGRADLAIANSPGDSVTVLLGNGSGGFTEAAGSPFATGSMPQALTTADFDGDGRLDIVTANAGSDDVTVLLGNGSGGFVPATGGPFRTGTHPNSLVAMDFNGDGKADLAISNLGGGVTVLLGSGSGGFSAAPGSPFAAGASPDCVVAADFNGDGKADLAVANYGASNVTLLLGNGLGGFAAAPHSPFAAGAFPSWIATGDFNGDGKIDFATANGNATVSVFFGDGAGNFFAGGIFAAAGTPQYIAAGDFNGDGNLDLAVANGTGGTLTILLGDGTGGFAAAAGSPLTVGTSPLSIAVADFNSDGKPDLAVADADGGVPGNNGVVLLTNNLPAIAINPAAITLNRGTGAILGSPSRSGITATVSSAPGPVAPVTITSSQSQITAGAALESSTAAPFSVGIFNPFALPPPGTYAGTVRAAAPGYFGGVADATLRVGTPSGILKPGTPISGAVNNRVLAAADFNGDGKPDLVSAGGGTGQLSVYLNGGTGGFTLAPGNPFGVGMDPTAIVTGDFNRDGIQDIAVASSSLNQIAVWLGKGTGGFAPAPGSPFATGLQPSSIVAGDFNRDGNLDLAVTNAGSNTVSVFSGNGLGRFAPSPGSPFATGLQPRAIAMGDFNGDGNLDLAVANTAGNSVTLLLGDGHGGFLSGPGPVTIANGPALIVAADFDGDGKIDLAVATSFNVNVLAGDGMAGFHAFLMSPFAAGLSPGALVVADFDGDGYPDIAVANGGGANQLTLLQGEGTGNFFPAFVFPTGAGPAALTAVDLNGDGKIDVAIANSIDGTISILSGAEVTVTLTLDSPGATFIGGAPVVTVPFGQLTDYHLNFSSANAFFSDAPIATATIDTTVMFTPGWLGHNTGGSLPVLNAGTHKMVANIVGDGRFSAATSSTLTIQVVPAVQTIGFSAVGNVFLGVAPFTVNATATSSLPVTVVSATPAVCKIVGSLVTVTAVGTCTLTGNQAGNGNYLAAPSATVQFNVTVAGTGPQSITFAPLTDRVLGIVAPVAATSTSGLAVKLVSTTPLVCHVAAGRAITTNSGICTIVASQPGSSTLTAATPVRRSFRVSSQGTGTFLPAPASPVATGRGPGSVVIADFNGDGKQDAAILNVTDNTVTLAMGDGTGRLAAGPAAPLPPGTNSIIGGDFNGDGFQDLLALGTSGIVTPLLGDGRGGFTTGTSSRIGGPLIMSAAAADLNGDGALDLIVVGNGSFVSVLLGDGAGQFSPGPGGAILLLGSVSSSGDGFAIAGDFNGDGFTDAAIASSAANKLFVLLGDGTGTLTQAPGSPYPANPTGLAGADFNGDGSPDLAVANFAGDGLAVFLNDGTGRFSTRGSAPFAARSVPWTVASGDFNGDGRQDIALVAAKDNEASLVFYPGDGTGGLGPSTPEIPLSAIPGFGEGGSLATGDFDGDGRQDLAFVTVTSDQLVVLLGSAAPTVATLTTAAALPAVNGVAFSVTASVASAGSAFAPPSGSVNFSLDGGVPVSIPLTGGAASFTVPAGTSGGNHTLIAGYTGTMSSGPSIATLSFAIAGAPSTISFAAPANSVFGAAPFAVSATASSGLTVGFVSNTPSVCAVSGITVSIVGAGTCSLTASQPGSAAFLAAASVTQMFTVARAAQAILFATLGNVSLGSAPVTLSATAGSGLAVSFTSNSPGICTVSGAIVSLAATIGTCSITASQAGNSNYLAAPMVTNSFTVLPAAQTITFGSPAPVPFNAAPFSLSATASSGLPVSFVSTTPAVCSVSGAVVTLVAAGSCSITATQSGNASTAAAPAVTQTFAVTSVSQTISFPVLSNTTFGVPPISLTATASSGLPIAFASTTSAVCMVSTATVAVTAAGICSIQASQSGNGNYLAAPTVSQTFLVAQATQTITFGPLAPVTLPVAPISLNATASSGLPVSYTAAPGACVVTDTTLRPYTPGICSVTASQPGNSNFAAAVPVTRSFTVSAPPSTGGAGGGDPPGGGTLYTLSAMPASLAFSAPSGASTLSSQQVFITIATTGAKVSYSAAVSDAWLTIQQPGISEQYLVVGTNPAGLPSGRYMGNVTLTSSQIDNGPFVIPVSLNIGPVITALTSAAGFAPGPMAGGSIAAVFGMNFTTSTLTAGLPLPTTLGCVSATVGGVPAPLFYVSPTQVNVQIPSGVPPGQATVTVRAGGAETTSQIQIQATSPGIFLIGKYAAAINRDGSVNGPEHPAAGGDFVSIFMTGQGSVDVGVPDGAATPDSPLRRVLAPVSATVGGKPAQVLFAGLAPELVGAMQLIVTVPADLASGDYPVLVTIGGVVSNSGLLRVGIK